MARLSQHLESLSVAVSFALVAAMFAAWGLAFLEGGSYYAALFDTRFLELAIVALVVPTVALAIGVELRGRLARRSDPDRSGSSTASGLAEKPPE